MRKKFLLLTLMAWIGLSVQLANAQIGLGGGFAYGTEVEKLGLDLRADFKLGDKWALAPNFNFFFPRETRDHIHRWAGFNFDAHYLFNVENSFYFYPLFGLNITSYSTERKSDDRRWKNSEIGVNIGMGSEFKIAGQLDGFVEFKYVAIKYVDQAVVSFGVLYRL
ncbi:MAG: outer membrane beta-barrel protein [Cyclobacteriaceae bacterium]